MELLIWVAVFIVSILVLVKAADFFTGAAEKIGHVLRLPSFVVGVIIVGFGTSLPELISSIIAVRSGSSEMVVGNVLGSNITNIFLVLGVVAILKPNVKIRYDLLKLDLPILLGSAFLVALMLWDLSFSLGEAVLCLVCLVFYFFSSFQSEKGPEATPAVECAVKVGFLVWLTLVVSVAFVYVGARYVVESVINLSGILSIGTDVIALSAVAIGTSLPEITVAISAARKGNYEMVIGNLIGSNIFNSFAVLAIPAFVGRLNIPRSIQNFALPVFVAATLLAVVIVVDRRLNRWEGALLLSFYLFFIGKLYGWM